MRIAAISALILALVVALWACQSSDVSRDLGARCATDSDCNVRCLPPGNDWPGGLCTVLCQLDADCPDGARCITEDGGVCAFSCDTGVDCAFLGSGYSCNPEDNQGGGTKVLVCRGD